MNLEALVQLMQFEKVTLNMNLKTCLQRIVKYILTIGSVSFNFSCLQNTFFMYSSLRCTFFFIDIIFVQNGKNGGVYSQ